MKKFIIILIAIILIVVVGSKFYNDKRDVKNQNQEALDSTPVTPTDTPPITNIPPVTNTNPPVSNEPAFCTMDAMQCPDGSYVGRSGPKCEFICPVPQVSTATTAHINQKVSNSGIRITPLRVIEDSRCPSDVECIWAGTVKLLVKLEALGKGKTDEVELTLGTTTTFSDRKLTFTKVTPYPVSNKQILEKDYEFTFSVK